MTLADKDMTAEYTSPKFLSGGGEMGARMRAYDWTGTALGAPDDWPQSLKTVVNILLSSRYAMWMLWGAERTFLCNDAYLPTLGVKGDWALGAASDKVWQEIWPDIGPRIERVLKTGEATWDEALLLFLERRGFREETYHTFSYSPLADDEGIVVGMLCVVTEETERVVGERRLRYLRDLGLRVGNCRAVEQVWSAVEASFEQDRHDLPWAIAYAFDDRTGDAHLVATMGVQVAHSAAPPSISIKDRHPWPLREVWDDTDALVLHEVCPEHGDLPTGPWSTSPSQASIVSIPDRIKGRPSGALVLGLNPHRPMDADFRGFIDLFVGQIAAGLAAADAYEAERRRAEALAQIDRAKTAFFANVSHEFRTPLTLMLGPLEELLARAPSEDAATTARLVEVAHRNSVRLLRLVNALLDFSRIEGGRSQAAFQPVDLAALTIDLASAFRAATDSAGLRLEVGCQPLSTPVYVDPAMWETIVLNLVSNAFKFTFEGEIGVELLEIDNMAQLTVSDTGTGIPEGELPRLFERFHRVEGAKGRSIEGSGVGLALVRELVALHGGRIAVESELGRGTAFTVSVPLGTHHLPPERIATTSSEAKMSLRPHAFVDEALRWRPGSDEDTVLGDVTPADTSAPDGETSANRERIVLADDNADLRDYISRLLRGRGYAVQAVGDGEGALAALRGARADLVVTDVMMPGLDGFGLLKAIRMDDVLRDLPVIVLSARAGEDAKIEGLDAGADDYLTKPFSARELLARVAANLAMARMRRDAAETIRVAEARAVRVLAGMGEGYVLLDRDYRVVEINDEGLRLERRGRDEVVGKTHWEAWPGTEHSAQGALYRKAMIERVPVSLEFPFVWPAGHEAWMEVRAYPSGDGLAIFYRDVSDRRQADVQLRELNATLERRVEERSAELLQAEDALRQAQKMEAVGQLTGGIAHDFNNLLTIVVGNVDMARRALTAGEANRAHRAMDNAQKGAERAAALTQRLLAFSRRQPLAPKPVDVDRLVAGMSDLLHRALGETIELEIVTSPGQWNVEADPNQLESAVLNLAVNARDAMPRGGKLTIETANARLDETYSANHAEVAPGQYVVIAVTDTGSGMSRETLARVFEPFFTTKEVGKGTGLGLSMVYGFTKQSGGHVKLYSEQGEGTTVKIYLPRMMGGVEEEPATSGGIERIQRKHTILVVEDDEDVRAYTVEILRELGYRVFEAHDGFAALTVLKNRDEAIALLLTDVVMPGMSGSELADQARRLRPDLKVLYTSGYTRNAIVHGGRLDPGVEMIAKPFTYQGLDEKISDVLDLGTTNRLLVAEADATLRMFAIEALTTVGYAVDEAATAFEALNRARAAKGRYDAVVLDGGLPDKSGEAVAVELRALYADLPILLTVRDDQADIKLHYDHDRCLGVIVKPYNAAKLNAALTELNVRCSRK